MNINPALIWIIIGVALVIAEVATTTFILLFFGVGCLAAALAAFLGLESINLQILVFAIVSGLSILFFRGKLAAALKTDDGKSKEDLTGENIFVDADIPPRASAKITFRGTTWTAVNDSDMLIRNGSEVTITGIDGVKLLVAPFQKGSGLKIS